MATDMQTYEWRGLTVGFFIEHRDPSPGDRGGPMVCDLHLIGVADEAEFRAGAEGYEGHFDNPQDVFNTYRDDIEQAILKAEGLR